MTTPNLDATGHRWVGALARFNFQLEYQKGCDNTVADVLSQITTCLNPDMVRSVLDGITLGATQRAESHDPTVVEGDHGVEKEVHVATGWVLVQMHMTDWAEAQGEDSVLSMVLDWLEAWKKTDLKTLLGEHASSEEGWLILWNHQNFMIHQKALYLYSMPKGENKDLLLFIVPKAHWVTTLNGCHGMQDIRAVTVLCPYCRSTFGGWGWPIRCSNPSRPVCTAYNMRAAYLRPLCTLSWPLLPGSLTCWFYQHRDDIGAEPVT